MNNKKKDGEDEEKETTQNCKHSHILINAWTLRKRRGIVNKAC